MIGAYMGLMMEQARKARPKREHLPPPEQRSNPTPIEAVIEEMENNLLEFRDKVADVKACFKRAFPNPVTEAKV